MKLHTISTVRRSRSAGIGLVTAIFLLVVLSGLAVALVSLFTSQQVKSNLDEQGARAYQAARAGAEWALWQQAQTHHCPSSPTTFPLPGNSSLSSFSVTVTCVQKDVSSGGGQALPSYVITAVACNLPGSGGCPNPSNNPSYVQRRVEVEI
jgi:MSHA biogenesis protein MshP